MSNPRRFNGSARDKLRRRVIREENVCHLCGQAVQKRLPHGLPGSPEVDELIPVSYGRTVEDRRRLALDRANCRLSHRWCNRRRGKKAVSVAIAEIRGIGPRFDSSGSLVMSELRAVASRAWL